MSNIRKFQQRVKNIQAQGETLQEATLRAHVVGAFESNCQKDLAAFEKRTIPAYGPIRLRGYSRRKKK